MHEFAVGRRLFVQKEFSRAVKAFHEALVSDPQNPRVWSYLGMSLAHSGRAVEAEQALQRAVAISPQNAEGWFHLGVARGLEAKWAEAAEAYRRAVAILPDDLAVWHRLGVALAEAGDEAGSAAAFERALILSRDDGDARRPERRVSGPVDNHVVEPGERAGPKEVDSWLSLALSLLALGEVEEAVAAYEKGYSIDPERARRSLFRPMLVLLTAAAGSPTDPGPDGPVPDRPTSPTPPPHRPNPAPGEPLPLGLI